MLSVIAEADTDKPNNSEQSFAAEVFDKLTKELFGEAELMLLTHWKREIDYDVKLKLIDSLGHIAGWTRLPKQNSWDVVDVLREAAGERPLL